MPEPQKVAIITGASQGIGAGAGGVKAFGELPPAAPPGSASAVPSLTSRPGETSEQRRCQRRNIGSAAEGVASIN
jgi:hypothetical protein